MISNHNYSLELRHIGEALFQNKGQELESYIDFCDDLARISTKLGDESVVETVSSKANLADYVKRGVVILAKRIGIKAPYGILVGVRPLKLMVKLIDEGLDYIEILKDYYLLEEDKITLLERVYSNQKGYLKGIKGLDLYVSIPFCPSRCNYCSFPSYSYDDRVAKEYINGLVQELELIYPLIEDWGGLDSIYFGGGTPSVFDEETIDYMLSRVFGFLKRHIPLEITYESGRPETITTDKLNILKGYNINRISINPQSMKDETLKLIGRNHSVEDVYKAFDLAKKSNFSSVNCDLILGLPGESFEDMASSLDKVFELSPQSITLHALAIKSKASLYSQFKVQNQSIEDGSSRMNQKLFERGYSPYYLYRQKRIWSNLENIGFALKGHESGYNIRIIDDQSSILAIGAGSKSKIVTKDKIKRFDNPKDIGSYLKGITTRTSKILQDLKEELI